MNFICILKIIFYQLPYRHIYRFHSYFLFLVNLFISRITRFGHPTPLAFDHPYILGLVNWNVVCMLFFFN